MSDESQGVFELDRIRRLVELMKEHDLSEVDLREDGQRIRLCRGAAPGAPVSVVTSLPAPAVAAPAASKAIAAPAEDAAHITVIRAPMVGTFYSRANPNAEPFVKVGGNVTPETTICIIEAMKVFNEIPAEVRGQVVAVLVDDETPVDFGKPLFKVDTSK